MGLLDFLHHRPPSDPKPGSYPKPGGWPYPESTTGAKAQGWLGAWQYVVDLPTGGGEQTDGGQVYRQLPSMPAYRAFRPLQLSVSMAPNDGTDTWGFRPFGVQRYRPTFSGNQIDRYGAVLAADKGKRLAGGSAGFTPSSALRLKNFPGS